CAQGMSQAMESRGYSGINHVIKRRKTLTLLKKEKVQIALLQETHLTDHEHSKLRRDWVGAFYSKFLAEVSPICPSHALIGGDFNTGLIPSSDYSPPKNQPLSKMAKATKGLCNVPGLFDAWRICNPNSFSRIDYLFVSRSILDKTNLCSSNPCVLSDHSSVFIELLPPYYDPLSRQWRLNPSLLRDPVFIKYLEDQWELYITTNDTPEVSATVLWEAGKAFLRGSIIFFTAAKKTGLTKQLDLEHQICTLERDLKQSSSPFVLKKLDAARSALDQLLTQKAETTIFYAKHRLFESGHKPGTLLARLAQGRSGSYAKPSLRDKRGHLHFESKMICKIMKDFYQHLHSPECDNTAHLVEHFLFWNIYLYVCEAFSYKERK
uniref:Endonuclease/exonuclease/phosphatase domain-containing protein n=1 Tax=Oryzias latipes TaxID=8090 RepID=A0A3B3I0L2_ORYLA